MTYKIIRHYPTATNRTIKTGLSLEEAQAHCRNPETSYRTATSPAGKARTRRFGQWFDGYTEEKPKRRTRDSANQRRANENARAFLGRY